MLPAEPVPSTTTCRNLPGHGQQLGSPPEAGNSHAAASWPNLCLHSTTWRSNAWRSCRPPPSAPSSHVVLRNHHQARARQRWLIKGSAMVTNPCPLFLLVSISKESAPSCLQCDLQPGCGGQDAAKKQGLCPAVATWDSTAAASADILRVFAKTN